MSSFVFKLESLLKFREHQRGLCRQLLAQVLADDARYAYEKEEKQIEQSQLNEQIEQLHQARTVEVDKISARRYYIGQLKIDVLQIDLQRDQIAQQIVLCRNTLIEADRKVKAIENIKEKQRLVYQAKLQKREDMLIEEAWQATHHGRAAS